MNDLLPTFDASDALCPEASWALMTLRLSDVVDEHLFTIHWSGLRRSATAILGGMGGASHILMDPYYRYALPFFRRWTLY